MLKHEANADRKALPKPVTLTPDQIQEALRVSPRCGRA